MIKPSLEDAKRLSQGYTLVPMALEIFSDQKTPIEIIRNIRSLGGSCFILESVNGGEGWGRYTFLGYNPIINVYGTGNTVVIKSGRESKEEKRNPIEVVKELIGKYKSPNVPGLPPFTGGFVGYFSYDFVQNCIPGLKLRSKNEEGFRDFHLMLIDKVIAFDHLKQKMYVIANIPVEDIENGYSKGFQDLNDLARTILSGSKPQDEHCSCGEFTSMFTEGDFKEMVLKIKSHIFEGDIFQAVVSNRFKAPFKGSLINTYRMLRTINPSPYMVYMRADDVEIACSSPETLASLQNGEVSSFPLAGTCPRGKTEEEDKALIEALLKDEKELAEHDMLVDLARNDIGKVCKFGTVKVRDYRAIKKYSHVSHISSHVTGEIRDDVDALDVLMASLPAGTLSGAPKKRACEIIDEAEGRRRGIYGGAIGYIDFTGNMDMCIGIRMAVLKKGNVFVQAGAGIVADSVPEKEYAETRNKARAVMKALNDAGGL
ncbi:anthranilate synthase component 1 [Candidatus Methanoplasma termitum]|uniref:Anthranilate synthase component 1 n=1 Tax=Candidatus Methanoplasma termitum TaxID=1577791 RepID=A0A0A7LA46_9ARCH|nr:anthranilate synthase component I family protein [Candidatus Methanoplasma termitum]AIZ55954.1 anthranilate synthase component 1 [Candidatus Methanoplasma termitum]MCL2334272.1 anthranilate synthase component I family protein [Candidatus Methanoplasma sp.]